MLKNYFKIAFRNLMKHKVIFGINLIGLTIGLTCCLLILTYIINELSFDKHHQNAKNIYRVERTFLNPETGALSLELGSIAPPFAPYLLNDFKEIKKLTRLLSNGNTSFKYEDKIFNEQDVFFADENLFSIFKVDVLKGNPAKALNDPYSVMLTEEVAKKYFGNDDPMNKEVRLDGNLTCKVTGVYKAFPSNTHLHPALMISFSTLRDSVVYGERRLRENWGNNSFLTYIELPEGYNPKTMEAQFPAFQNRHIPLDADGKIKPSDYSRLSLKKLTDIHLYSHTDYEAEVNGDIKRVYIFSAIALFILLIACINYMNLSTARSVLRAKEIGVRKVVGARRPELIAQFLSESVLLSWVATILAISLTWLALPWLNELSGQELSISILFNWKIILPLLLVPFVVGIMSGIYPALFLSSFQPIKTLKGLMKVGGSNISFRKVLVVVQFSISIVLIIATAIAFRQLSYMQDKSLGFNKDHIVNLGYVGSLNDSYEAFKTELLSNTSVQSVSRSSRIPSGRLLDAMGSQINHGDSLAPTKADIKYILIDEGFVPTFGLKTVAGRNFSKDFAADSVSFVVNEAAVKVLGVKSPEEIPGKQFGYGMRKGQLIGVINDFHFESLHQRILPMVFLMRGDGRAGGYGNLSIKVSGNNIPGALAHIEKVWKKFLPEAPYDYTFLDNRFEKLYEAEQKQGTIFTVFSFIAIFIACLGLLGLSAFAISQRVKEIGIRKVLGANAGNIVGLLSKDFLKLVIIAALIAFPVAWLMMSQWLEDFAYRIDIPWWIFIVAGVIAAAVAFVTISFQAIKAANANPVLSLRTE